jgi:hypothetical protein
MKSKSVLFGFGVALFLSGVGAMLVLMVFHEPAVYARSGQLEGDIRQRESGQFNHDFIRLYQDLKNPTWEALFTEKSINSYFEEDFIHSGVAKSVLPEGVSAPRVAIEPDKLRLAFRYNLGPWNAIISIDMRMWLASNGEPNVIALELQSLHAGSLPISAQSLLEQIFETARQNGIKVTWYRYHGNPVALLRFQADEQTPTIQFLGLQLDTGRIVIKGRSIDAGNFQTLGPRPDSVVPAAN